MKKKVVVQKKGCGRCMACGPKKKIKDKVKSKKSLVSRVVKLTKTPINKPKGRLIGTVTHYFAHVKVGVISLTKPLKIGDEIRIIGGNDTDFSQEVKSMEEEHVKLKTAKSGHSIGLKVKKQVREGYKVFKV